METQTGFQNRRLEQTVHAASLRNSLATAPHSVSDIQRASLDIQVPDIYLDPGERSLWAHALQRTDEWFLCGPDKASLRTGVRLGFRERLTALETLLEDIGYRPRIPLKKNYTGTWHAQTVGEFVIMETRDRS